VTQHNATDQSPPSADDLISEATEKGWQPPPVFLPELEKILEHNRKHPERHIGSIKVAQWLGRNKVEVSKDAVYRWMKHRSKGSK
jgi:hypothetical protein